MNNEEEQLIQRLEELARLAGQREAKSTTRRMPPAESTTRSVVVTEEEKDTGVCVEELSNIANSVDKLLRDLRGHDTAMLNRKYTGPYLDFCAAIDDYRDGKSWLDVLDKLADFIENAAGF